MGLWGVWMRRVRLHGMTFRELFGKGSVPHDELDKYPSPEEILDYMDDRRAAFLEALDACTDEDFHRPVTTGPRLHAGCGRDFPDGSLARIASFPGNSP